MEQKRMMHLSLSLPLGDEASAAMAAYQIEQVVQRELGEPETFVGGFHIVFPNELVPLPSPGVMMKDMISELRDAGMLPKKEPWEEKADDEEKET